jgi:uncharacterized protein YjcR
MTKPAVGPKPDKPTLRKLYLKQSMSVRKIAEILGCTKDMVYRALKEYGIEARTNARWSNLKKYDLKYLEDGVKQKGLRAFARELKVGNSALLQHIKARKERQ